MNQTPKKDTWAAGNLYEPYVGRWSRLVARDFLNWVSIPSGKDWLDVGCGTGALTQAILDLAAPTSVCGLDPSSGFIEHARAHVKYPCASFSEADAQALPEADEKFDVAVSGLVLNFVPNPSKAVEEMVRVVRRGGTVAGYVWDYSGEMQLMRYFWDAAVDLNPKALDLDEGRRFPICNPARLKALFSVAGLTGIQTRAIEVPTLFRDFEDYWTPFLGGQAPAPGYCMSLSEKERTVLRDLIRSRLPARADGAIPLFARAWGVQGRK